MQQKSVWPANVVVAKAYIDQLNRSKAISADRSRMIIDALGRAGKIRSGELDKLVGQLEHDATGASARDALRSRLSSKSSALNSSKKISHKKAQKAQKNSLFMCLLCLFVADLLTRFTDHIHKCTDTLAIHRIRGGAALFERCPHDDTIGDLQNRDIRHINPASRQSQDRRRRRPLPLADLQGRLRGPSPNR